jgi:hypothetical protein
MKKALCALAGVAALLCSITAQASVYKLDFTATGFVDVFDNAPAPQSSISGSILFTTAAPGGPATSIDKIDLTIDGHAYSTAEIGAEVGNGSYYFGGTLNGIHEIDATTDDFWFVAFPSGYVDFSYAVSDLDTIFDSTSVAFTVTEQTAQVPEPGSVALLMAGIGGLGAALRRRRRT